MATTATNPIKLAHNGNWLRFLRCWSLRLRPYRVFGFVVRIDGAGDDETGWGPDAGGAFGGAGGEPAAAMETGRMGSVSR